MDADPLKNVVSKYHTTAEPYPPTSEGLDWSYATAQQVVEGLAWARRRKKHLALALHSPSLFRQNLPSFWSNVGGRSDSFPHYVTRTGRHCFGKTAPKRYKLNCHEYRRRRGNEQKQICWHQDPKFVVRWEKMFGVKNSIREREPLFGSGDFPLFEKRGWGWGFWQNRGKEGNLGIWPT